jgi:hypothetical protein
LQRGRRVAVETQKDLPLWTATAEHRPGKSDRRAWQRRRLPKLEVNSRPMGVNCLMDHVAPSSWAIPQIPAESQTTLKMDRHSDPDSGTPALANVSNPYFCAILPRVNTPANQPCPTRATLAQIWEQRLLPYLPFPARSRPKSPRLPYMIVSS